MPYEALDSAASQSQGEARRKVGFAVDKILAKIYVTPTNPTPLTDGNKKLIDSAFVFVMIPPKEPPTSQPPTQEENATWRGWSSRIDILLKSHKHSDGKFKYPLNIQDMITKNLIYKKTKTDTGEYYYVVQGFDILGGSDDSRLLVSEKDFQDKKQFNLVGHSEFRGGNKCSLKPKSNKRNKKQNKLNSRRRRYRSRKH